MFAEVDFRRERQLKRGVEDAKRTARLVRSLIIFDVILFFLLLTSVICGGVFHIGVFGGIGGVGLIVWFFVTLACCIGYFVEECNTPFSDVRDAERRLEDYYDEIGANL